MKTRLMFACLLFVLGASAVQAAVDCTEKVVAVIIHSNGNVYFQTDHTCSGTWCALSWSDADRINKAYAMLLAAKARGTSLVFDWASLGSCNDFNTFGAAPGYISQLE